MKPILVIDTNIILLDANNLLMLGKDYTVVLPETVLDEIDVKKSSIDPELRYQVREFGRIFTKATRINKELDEHGNVAITRTIDDTTFITVALSTYRSTDAEPSIRNDNKIIDVAQWCSNKYHNVTFMTNDIMCGERALARGITTIDLKIVTTKPLEFTKTLSVDSITFTSLHHTPIELVDITYEAQNYNYCFKDEVTGQVKLGNIRNGLIDILGKDTETELRRQDATPTNSDQLFLSRAIQNPNIDIVVSEASAGTGKTVSAFSNAIQLVKRKEYSGIVYIRTSVDDSEKSEDNGFRSGNDEKVAPFFYPVDDTLDFLVRSRYKENKLKGRDLEAFIQEKKNELIEKYNISTSITLGMRGRTFHDTIAIIDEAQNMSRSSMQKVLTRFGKNCKIIIIGSNKQIDNPYITKYTNGLSVLLDACTKPQEVIRIHAVPLSKIIRSDIAKFAEETFAK